MQSNMQKFPSMSSVHSLISQGYLPPGHGFIPKKQKPDKPFGPTFVTIMNRTWRGPGQKYLRYALICMCFAIFFILASGLYLGHRNVMRLIVLRTEVFGAIFTILAICSIVLMFHFIFKAREESNRWRKFIRFRAEGLFTAAAYNDVYHPEDRTKLQSGTYTQKALMEIPKPKGMRGKKKGRSRAASQSSNAPGGPRGQYDKRGPPGMGYEGPMDTLAEQHEPGPVKPQYPPPMHGPPQPGPMRPQYPPPMHGQPPPRFNDQPPSGPRGFNDQPPPGSRHPQPMYSQVNKPGRPMGTPPRQQQYPRPGGDRMI